MTALRVLAARLASFFGSARTERDLDDEIQDHIERTIADNLARGMSRDRAETAAAATFGSRLRVREAHAEMRGLPFLENLWRDGRYALRGYSRAPTFTLVVVATLGLGIGATSAIFALVNAVVLKPLPYPASDRLAQIAQLRRDVGRKESLSPPNFFDVKERSKTFVDMAAYWTPTVTLSPVGGTAERVFGTLCTSNLMAVLGVSPLLGRPFNAADERPGTMRVALISDALWRRQFGADPAVVGRGVLIDDAPAQIVGVMPATVDFPNRAIDLWLPLGLSRTQPPNPAIPTEKYRGYRILNVVGRLRPDVTLAQAQADLSVAADALAREYPNANRLRSLTLTPLHDAVVGDVRPAMLLFLGAVSCLLIVAAANVATMVAVRTASRERELMLRLALGAGRVRLMQQLLIESVMLAMAGGATGLGCAYGVLRVLLRFAPAGIPRIETAHIDAAVVLFTFAAAAVAGLAFGTTPALEATRAQLVDALKAGGRSTSARSRQRLRRAFVVSEVALSMLLLVTAGLLAQTFVRLGRVEVGFRSAGVFTFDRLEVARRTTSAETATFFEALLRRVGEVRGVDVAGITLGVPLDPKGRFFIDETSFTIDARPPVPAAERPTARIHVVSGGYFGALGIPLLEGRAFTEAEGRDSTPVVIINRALADRYFPSGDAVGHVLNHELAIVAGHPTRRRIVGVAANVRQFRLDEAFEPQMFVPHTQMPWPAMALVVKSSLRADQMATAIRAAVWSLDRRMPVPVPIEMTHVFDAALGEPRLRAWLLAVFAGAAMLLAAIGLYGTVAFAAQQRRTELAIRLVLGATPRQTSALVIREGLTLAIAGAAAGIAAALGTTRLLSTLLFGVGALDPWTIASVAGLLLAVTAAACYVPAYRVARIDPLVAINGN